MALLNNTQREYYQGSDYGNYQFTSLKDIINQFMVVYVGEGKAISKASRVEVAFHAQRAMQELSFDTFKSIKSQEIELPPSLTMILPHDYVNYVKLTFSDSAGIEHVLYPTSKTSNPFAILQEDDGNYDFVYRSSTLVKNSDFADSSALSTGGTDWTKAANVGDDKQSIVSEKLEFEHNSNAPIPGSSSTTSRAYAVWQEIDVTNVDVLDFKATGASAASGTNKGVGVLRVGISTFGFPGYNFQITNPNRSTAPSLNNTDDIFDVFTEDGNRALLTFNDGLQTESTAEITDVDVRGIDTIYVLITSFIEDFIDPSAAASKNTVDNVIITCDALSDKLQTQGDSDTWNNFKAHTPAENNINDYQDYQNHIYWPNEGERYGLDPQHAQVNGSFYIDELKGLIHFSSSLANKTIILKYISDGLGTEEEMKVHKFAEEAMYRSISYAIISASSYGQNLARRFKREKFAAVRQAKLRLSNIKLEEITQVLRGKSKQIKH
tara:strand:- start:10152 stop:11633 length:1482 start_codon:yes stop_codon:yes gene_type:complete